jgi:hypothetical protein
MRRARVLLTILIALAGVSASLSAQEKSKSEAKAAGTTLKVQVTIAETEGEKKVASLPYTYFLRAGDAGPSSPWTKLRVGSRIPVYTGKEGSMQYLDVGTNIDSRAISADEGRFDVTLSLERSWVEGDVLVPMEKPVAQSSESHPGQFHEPVIRQFKTELTLPMRDGQTTLSTLATDPLTGKILSITLTISVVK